MINEHELSYHSRKNLYTDMSAKMKPGRAANMFRIVKIDVLNGIRNKRELNLIKRMWKPGEDLFKWKDNSK